MNSLLKFLVGILIIEILLGYLYYQKRITLLTGNYISSIILASESKTIKSLFSFKNKENEQTNELNINSRVNVLNTTIGEKEKILSCNDIEKLNLIFQVSSMRTFRAPLMLQSSFKFFNTIDLKDKYLIAITGNSEGYGMEHEKKLQTILEEKLNEKFKTDKIFVLNISNPGYLLNDQLIALKYFLNIYEINLAIFYTGGNELSREKYTKETIRDEDFIVNTKNETWYTPHRRTIFAGKNNKYQECLNENIFITKENINNKHNFYEADIYILKKYEEIKREFNKKKLDYLFFIQPFNDKQISAVSSTDFFSNVDYRVKKNWEKFKKITAPDDKFINLSTTKIDIDFMDRFHTKDISVVANIMFKKIITLYSSQIENQI